MGAAGDEVSVTQRTVGLLAETLFQRAADPGDRDLTLLRMLVRELAAADAAAAIMELVAAAVALLEHIGRLEGEDGLHVLRMIAPPAG